MMLSERLDCLARFYGLDWWESLIGAKTRDSIDWRCLKTDCPFCVARVLGWQQDWESEEFYYSRWH